MFINDNFKEIDEKLNISLNYLNNKKLLEILEKKFKIIMVNNKKKILRFNTSNEILRHIKNTGVNTINKTKLTKNKICDFINRNTLNLTYNYNFIIARKKMNYSEFNRKYIWHPFTQETTAPLNINIVKGKTPTYMTKTENNILIWYHHGRQTAMAIAIKKLLMQYINRPWNWNI